MGTARRPTISETTSRCCWPFDGPVDGQPDWPMGRELDEGLQEDSVRQVPRLQPCVVEQPRQAAWPQLPDCQSDEPVGLDSPSAGQ